MINAIANIHTPIAPILKPTNINFIINIKLKIDNIIPIVNKMVDIFICM